MAEPLEVIQVEPSGAREQTCRVALRLDPAECVTRNDRSPMKLSAQNRGTDHASCQEDLHSASETAVAAPERKAAKKYFCPMCEKVESDTPANCPKCGMALERSPAFREPKKIIYTCPMHPQIQQDRPGICPICGMTLESRSRGVGVGNEEQYEANSLSRKFSIALVL